jgi:hypothetical protein
MPFFDGTREIVLFVFGAVAGQLVSILLSDGDTSRPVAFSGL